MNEQDIAAADAILLMEAEEKVKMRILQVVSDVVWGYKDSVLPATYESTLQLLQNQIRFLARDETKQVLNNTRITTN